MKPEKDVQTGPQKRRELALELGNQIRQPRNHSSDTGNS